MTLSATGYFLGCALLLAVAAMGFFRIARGPTLFDRIIGFDTILIAIVAVVFLCEILSNQVKRIFGDGTRGEVARDGREPRGG